MSLEGKTHEELLHLALTGENPSTVRGVVFCAMRAAAADLEGLRVALKEPDSLLDPDDLVYRIQLRLEIAAELARRDFDGAKTKRPRPTTVLPIKRESGPFAEGPES